MVTEPSKLQALLANANATLSAGASPHVTNEVAEERLALAEQLWQRESEGLPAGQFGSGGTVASHHGKARANGGALNRDGFSFCSGLIEQRRGKRGRLFLEVDVIPAREGRRRNIAAAIEQNR